MTGSASLRHPVALAGVVIATVSAVAFLTLLAAPGLLLPFRLSLKYVELAARSPEALARALITEPKLLLADEPTGNLDAAIGEEIGQTLVDYARKHSAITIIATHSASLAQMCDRNLVLKDGRTHLTGFT